MRVSCSFAILLQRLYTFQPPGDPETTSLGNLVLRSGFLLLSLEAPTTERSVHLFSNNPWFIQFGSLTKWTQFFFLKRHIFRFFDSRKPNWDSFGAFCFVFLSSLNEACVIKICEVKLLVLSMGHEFGGFEYTKITSVSGKTINSLPKRFPNLLHPWVI